MPGSLHILVISFFVFLLLRTTKIIIYVRLPTHFARQERQNRNLKNNQNHTTKVTKIRKKSYENGMSQTLAKVIQTGSLAEKRNNSFHNQLFFCAVIKSVVKIS